MKSRLREDPFKKGNVFIEHHCQCIDCCNCCKCKKKREQIKLDKIPPISIDKLNDILFANRISDHFSKIDDYGQLHDQHIYEVSKIHTIIGEATPISHFVNIDEERQGTRMKTTIIIDREHMPYLFDEWWVLMRPETYIACCEWGNHHNIIPLVGSSIEKLMKNFRSEYNPRWMDTKKYGIVILLQEEITGPVVVTFREKNIIVINKNNDQAILAF